MFLYQNAIKNANYHKECVLKMKINVCVVRGTLEKTVKLKYVQITVTKSKNNFFNLKQIFLKFL